jgi:hypothetical protein
MENVLTTPLIEKEEIAEMSFENPPNFFQSPDLKRKIADSLLLGNSYHTKVTILFQDDEGMKKVNTTIWASGSRFVCLKGGLWIPIDHIIDIELV